MAVKRISPDAQRKSVLQMGIEDGREIGRDCSNDELLAGIRAATRMVDRNYAVGKKAAAARYEGKAEGFRQLLRERGEYLA